MCVVAHDLHLEHIPKEISCPGTISKGDRQVIESEILPFAWFCSDRICGRDKRGGAVVIIDVADKIIGEDFLSVGGGKGQPMSHGHFWWKCLVESLVDNLATR